MRKTNPFFSLANGVFTSFLFLGYNINMQHTSDGLSTQGIKYAGSKKKLLPYLLALAAELPGVQTVLDGFSGTTRVAQALARRGYTVTANDTADWSEVFATCYLLSSRPDSFYAPLLAHLNSLPGQNGWFSRHYGGKETDAKKPFRLKNMQKLDAIRAEIDRMPLAWPDKCVLLSSLMLALDKVDSTLGHFCSYLSRWSARSAGDLPLHLPHRFAHGGGHRVWKQDIFQATARQNWDLAYFDPPYGSNNVKMPSSRVRYAAYYHFWTTLIRNDRPELFGAAARRTDSRDRQAGSVFEDFRRAPDGHLWALHALQKLLAQTQARYIMLSYSSAGSIAKEDLLDALRQNGKLLKFLKIDYKKNIMSEMSWTGKWTRDEKNYEYIFLIQKSA